MTRLLGRLDPIRHPEQLRGVFTQIAGRSACPRRGISSTTLTPPDFRILGRSRVLSEPSSSQRSSNHRLSPSRLNHNHQHRTPVTVQGASSHSNHSQIPAPRSFHTSMSTRSSSGEASSGASAQPTTANTSPSSADASSTSSVQFTPNFPVSPVPPNPLGEGRHIKTAAALIIGDEILNGKTMDSNSHVFAQFCFQHGIDLKRIEVVPDDEGEIIEAARRLSSKFDLVVTSGGIGPTHDDITYASLAKAFNTPLVHHQETIRRMKIMNRHRKWATLQNQEQKTATLRMALFPESAEVIFVHPELWVPVVRLNGNLCIFPGVPGLFRRMLSSLADFIPLPPKSERSSRIQIFTERAESIIAPYLTRLQERLRPHNIQVGSYPILYKGVFVSLIGKNPDVTTDGESQGNRICLSEIAKEVESEIGGRVLTEEEIRQKKCAIESGAPQLPGPTVTVEQAASGSMAVATPSQADPKKSGEGSAVVKANL